MQPNFISPKNFHDIATEIVKPKFVCGKSIKERTVVDRAYYAAFLHAREWVKRNIENNELNNAGRDHGTVIHEINRKHPDKSLAYKVTSCLKSLRKIRNDATYNLTDDPLESKGKITIFEVLDDAYFVSEDLINL
jgi:hypothetical protein